MTYWNILAIIYKSLQDSNDGSRKCRNWQTSKTKDLVMLTSCGFKSHLPHEIKKGIGLDRFLFYFVQKGTLTQQLTLRGFRDSWSHWGRFFLTYFWSHWNRPRDCPDRYYIISASAPDHISPSAEYQTHQIFPPLSLLPLRPYWTKMPPPHLWRRGLQYYY